MNYHDYTLTFMSEEKQLDAIEKNAYAISYIINPSEKLLMAAIKKDPYAVIRLHIDLTEEMQLEAVKRGGSTTIQYIKNPSEAVKIAAVSAVGYAINYILNPSEEVQYAAIENEYDCIRFIKDKEYILSKYFLPRCFLFLYEKKYPFSKEFLNSDIGIKYLMNVSI